eukprot:COSAG04_NODE_222_length_19676_cov_26.070991_13_plen_68_part_00
MEQKAIQEVEAAKKREEKMEEKRREQRGGKKVRALLAAVVAHCRLHLSGVYYFHPRIKCFADAFVTL